jgi:hypothetical protein
MPSAEDMAEVRLLCPEAKEMDEGGRVYVHLPDLILPEGCQPSKVEALVCLSSHSGYTTRLFLSKPLAGRGANWTEHSIFGRKWHTWSFNNVSAALRPMQVLAAHLRGLT